MLTSAKAFLQRILRSCGWEIQRYVRTDLALLAIQLQERRIDLVLDVGANEGQFGSGLFEAGYTGRLRSFEPLPDAYGRLMTLSKRYDGWSLAKRAAVGSSAGEVAINVSLNSVSSSILPIEARHVAAASRSKYVGKEVVEIVTLDDQVDLGASTRQFIKIDTQGYELEVLRGANQVLTSARGLQVEISLTELYAGQAAFLDVITFIQDRGFNLWSINPGFRDPKTSQLLQCDAIFFRGD